MINRSETSYLLSVIQRAGQRDLIAMYAGALGDNAVERYAMFLTSLDLSADIKERRLALTRAREHGLDVDRVAIVAAERTIEKSFDVCDVVLISWTMLTCNSPVATSVERPTSIDHRAAKSTVGGGVVAAPLHRVDNLHASYL